MGMLDKPCAQTAAKIFGKPTVLSSGHLDTKFGAVMNWDEAVAIVWRHVEMPKKEEESQQQAEKLKLEKVHAVSEKKKAAPGIQKEKSGSLRLKLRVGFG